MHIQTLDFLMAQPLLNASFNDYFFVSAEVAQCIISCSGPLTSLIAYDDCR